MKIVLPLAVSVLLAPGVLSPQPGATGCPSEQAAAPHQGSESARRAAPEFAPGQIFRYQIDLKTSTESRTGGLAEDPQGPAQLEMSLSAVLRLEVLSAPPGQLRLRATYEKSRVTTRGDTYDPQTAQLEDQYRGLEGLTFEFTLEKDGGLGPVASSQEVSTDPKAAAATREWLSQLLSGAAFPPAGAAPGGKWSSEKPLSQAPLTRMVWRSQSQYLRDGPCRTLALGESGSASPDSAETCAIVLTQIEIRQRGSPRDPTPDDYRQRGLRTSGKLSGSGESLSYISLRTGLLVSATQAASEELDLTVSSAQGELQMRYSGRVRTQSNLSLLPETPPL